MDYNRNMYTFFFLKYVYILTLKDICLTIPFSLLVPTPSKAKFFNISQPMAPHPTYGEEKYIKLNKIRASTY